VTTVLVTGSRWWSDEKRIEESLLKIQPSRVLVGDALGADSICRRVCRRHGIPYKVFPAHWTELGRAAGPMRNQEMIDAGPNLVLAFLHPKSIGTVDTINRAVKAGILVIEHNWDLPPGEAISKLERKYGNQ
jgi:YspA, cpYpsA-related SLOG family